MLDIGREIEILLNECDESIAEIARRSRIDRSTLYKIVNGQRLPTAEQLDALMNSLRVTPAQRRTLLEIAESLRLGPEEQRQNAQIEALLGVLLNAGDAVKPPPPPREETVPRSGVLFGAAAISNLLCGLLHRHARHAPDQPVMLSGGHLPLLADCVQQAFGACTAPVPVWQILYYVKNTSAPYGRTHNLQAFAGCVPLLLCRGAQYRARVCYRQAAEDPLFSPLPHFVLLADRAVFLSTDGQAARYEADPETVGLLRREFGKQFFAQANLQALRRVDEDPAAIRRRLAAACSARFSVRAAPPVLTLLSDDAQACLAAELPVPAAPPDGGPGTHHFFSEAGFWHFVRTGAVPDLPHALLPPQVRKKVLAAMEDTVRRGSPSLCMLTAPFLSAPDGVRYLEIFEGQGVLFGLGDAACRVEYLLEESTITAMLVKYFTQLKSSSKACDPGYLLHLTELSRAGL